MTNRVIVSIGGYYAIVHPFVKPFLTKVGEKIAEDFAGDIYELSKKKLKNLYNDIRRAIQITTGHARKLKNPTEVIFEITGTPYIELHAKPEDLEILIKAISPARLAKVHHKVAVLQENLRIEEAHFNLTDKGQWHFTYLITDDGTLVGTKVIVKKRDHLVQRIQLSPTRGYSIGADVTYVEPGDVSSEPDNTTNTET